jgi:hypothetical protein
MNDAVPLAFLGTVLGVAAYMFGARRIGASAAVFSEKTSSRHLGAG